MLEPLLRRKGRLKKGEKVAVAAHIHAQSQIIHKQNLFLVDEKNSDLAVCGDN